MNKILIYRAIATLGFLGYLKGSGTIATVLTIFFIICKKLGFKYFQISENAWLEFIIYCLITLISSYIIDQVLDSFREKDPSAIVLDEVVGTLWSSFLIQFSAKNYLCMFLLFRFFDITKIGIIKYAEKLPRAWGITGDDVLAAFFTHLLLRTCIYFNLL